MNNKGTSLGPPSREAQEYNRNIIEYKDPGRYTPIIFLPYSWGSLFGVPNQFPINTGLQVVQDFLHQQLGWPLETLEKCKHGWVPKKPMRENI